MSEDLTPADFEADAAQADALDVEQMAAEIKALKEQVLRYAAEAENTKRRAEREANDARAYAITKFARDLLGVADTFDRALTAAPQSGEDVVRNFVVGVEMTAKELQSAFDKNGLKKIDPPKGEKFDPHKHQAMMEQPAADGVEPGGVIQTLQAGYELLGRLVRPAMVVVAAKGGGAQAGPSSSSGGNPYGAGGEGDPGGSVDTRA
ncbi:nucleotide exchange factor GrpE [Phenylobacterium sp. SCN 70-31]|uniref:nucleotide exchange factor GrpE n=1 Tax=Phenylobacterium sp. SCN 70-31 TaxID=1660129 RepID=UPI00086BF7E1|nr:nucleotide exchange factor GrpE [Phenylobacterium sp. SCN 70-31]ODT89207.1 MAG: nucleotide exchange factor GrpE [Phenylobacterium sp. SCN 70-31]